jgi:hypothetical protein
MYQFIRRANLLSRLSPQIDEIIGNHQCGFRRNGSTTDKIFCIRQILEKKCEYNETVHQLFTDFKKDYDYTRNNRRIVGRFVLHVVYVVSREVGD